MKKKLIGIIVLLVILVVALMSCVSFEDSDTTTSESEPVATVEPAPISISINDLVRNSAGTPELYVSFTNTGDANIVAMDFWVECYDAYGDVIKGCGDYDYYAGTYDKGISVGGSSPSDCQWSMYGFDNTTDVKVGIIKYKLEGGDTVEIPENEIVWVE